jgi:glycosyltransferase involved in cell wall biosynthesis
VRVLSLNHADQVGGGAAIAGLRLHQGLRRAGVESRLLVGTKAGDDPDVHRLEPARGTRAFRKVARELGLTELGDVAAYRVRRSADVAWADVVHAHAIHGSWFSYPAIAGITRDKPSVLTLHDMWPFTGHCSFSYDCERWRAGCGHCPYPETFPGIERDGTAVEHRIKRRVWGRSQLVVVSPSEWLARLARESMLGRFEVRVIPHGIDTEVFAPAPDRGAVRARLGIGDGRTALMFAATALARPHGGELDRKGGDLLMAALAGLSAGARARCTTILMGGGSADMAARLRTAGFEVADAGWVADEAAKAELYSAADAFVFPTRHDNAPLVIVEALACGTPVVSFDVGGVGEAVRTGETGVVVPPGDVAALTEVLERAVADIGTLGAPRAACRAAVERDHPEALAVARHVALYEELLR